MIKYNNDIKQLNEELNNSNKKDLSEYDFKIQLLKNEIYNIQKNIQKLDLSKEEDNIKIINMLKSIQEKNKGIKHLESKKDRILGDISKPIESKINNLNSDVKNIEKVKQQVLNLFNNMNKEVN